MKRKNVIVGLILSLIVSVSTGNSPEGMTGPPEHDAIEAAETVILASKPVGVPLRKEHINRNLENYSGFGYRMHPVHKRRLHHQGIDLPAPTGTPAYSTSYGVVKAVIHKRTGYGKHVIIQSDKYEIVYAHLSKIKVKEGERVSPGTVVGLVGSTGTSTAPHLHYEIRSEGSATNPIPFM